MATVTATFTQVSGQAQVVSWTPLTTTNTDGSSAELPYFSDRSVQVSGTFGTGGSVTLQGSNDNSTWAALHDVAGSAITLTSAGIKKVSPNTRYIRPLVTAGDGTTSLTVSVYAAKSA